MTTELFYLCWACVLGLVHAVATGQFTTLQHGVAYGLSSRDEKREVTGVGGRVQRAFANYMQTFAFFAAAVLIGHVLNRHGWNTSWGAPAVLLGAAGLCVPVCVRRGARTDGGFRGGFDRDRDGGCSA